MNYTIIRHTCIYFILILIVGCDKQIASYTENNKVANIYPEYTGTYIPHNIAPINFQIKEVADEFKVRFVSQTDSFEVSAKSNVDIPIKKWKKLLEENKGQTISVKIFAYTDNNWTKYNNIDFTIANEPIDPYIAYRLIEPGYAAWNKMGLYQRCVENFEESPIIENDLTDGNCMNCHSFKNNDPEVMLFHMRSAHAGTMFAVDGEVKRVNTKAPWMMSAGVYPRWHPNGRYVAFSTNNTSQSFLTAHTNKIEVFDMNSDIVIYDTKENKVYTDSLIMAKNSFETFPEWSPNGRYMYFSSAPATQMPNNYKKIQYDILRVPFDPETGKFGAKVDTLVSAQETGKSSVLGRVSPDGKYMVFCMANYGTFPIWHRENDLHLLNLETGDISNLTDVNSDDSDSYHSWSSNGRWLVFSSRRIGGTYTRVFISYFDESGKGHTPILLPQKDPMYYDYFMKSYNIPECIKGKVKVTPYQLSDAAREDAVVPAS